MRSYFTSKKGKEPAVKTPAKTPDEKPEDVAGPVLSSEDEAFLHRIASEGTPPPLPERPRPQDLPVAGETEENQGQLVLLSEAQDVPLPSAPDTPAEDVATAIESERSETVREKEKEKPKDGKKPFRWSFLRKDSRDGKRKAKVDTATDLQSVADALKPPGAQPNEDHVVADPEAKKEEEEMTAIMEELNLAAVNNRVFSISAESKELLQKYAPFPLFKTTPLLLSNTR